MQAASQGSRNRTPDNSFDHGGANSVDIELVELGGSPGTNYVTEAASQGHVAGTRNNSINHGSGNSELNGSGGSPDNRHRMGGTPRRTPEDERQTSGSLWLKGIVTGTRNNSIDYGSGNWTRPPDSYHGDSPRTQVVRETTGSIRSVPDGGILLNEKVVPIIEPTRPQISGLSEDVEFWDTYLKEAEEHDREMIASWGSDLDSILIFAGLFSAVNTAFIVESYISLKADPADVTNTLLRILINRTDNTTFVGADPSELLIAFSPGGVRNNAVFFASLATSLLAAFGAVLAKQWLNQYLRIGEARSARSERGRARQRKFDGLVKWKFQPVVEALPLLLQTSLVLFFIALIDFLWALNRIVGSTVVVLTGLGFVAYMFTTVSSALYEDCPFQTPISHSLRPILRKIKHSWSLVIRQKPESGSENRQPNKIEASTDMIDAQTVAWLLQTVGEIKPRIIATRAIRYLKAPAIHPYFAAKETIGTLMTSFASCFQERRIDHDGKTVYTASPAVLDMVDASGHALCRILSTVPHGPTHEAHGPYPYADLLPSLDTSEFLVEDSQGSRCYTAHHLSRVIKWMVSEDSGINLDISRWIKLDHTGGSLHSSGMSRRSQDVRVVYNLGVLSSVPSDWEKLQFSHVFNYISNCPGSLPSVEDDLISICCKLLEQRPLPPLNILCDVLLTPAWIATAKPVETNTSADFLFRTRKARPVGIRLDADFSEIREASSSKSLNLCLLLFLEATTPPRIYPINPFRECTSKLLDDLVTHGIYLGQHYTQRYLRCARNLLHIFEAARHLHPEPESYNLGFADPGLRILDAIRPALYLQDSKVAPSTHVADDEDMLLFFLNVSGIRCIAFTSGAISPGERDRVVPERNVLSLLWALGSNAVGEQRQILPVAMFETYPNIPHAICYAIQVFTNNATSTTPSFNKTVEFPTRLLEECMDLWFDHRETNVHKLFIDARFGETLLALLQVPSYESRVPDGLNRMCRRLVHQLTLSRPDLWAPAFSQASMLHLAYWETLGKFDTSCWGLDSQRWFSRLLIFWDIEHEFDEIDLHLVRNLLEGIGEYKNSNTIDMSHIWAQGAPHSRKRMLHTVTIDGIIAYTYMAIAANSLVSAPFFKVRNTRRVERTISWRLEQDCPEDMVELIRCVQQRLVPPHDYSTPFEPLAKEPCISTWKRYRAKMLAYFADIDLQAPSLENPRWRSEETPRESVEGRLGENLRESLEGRLGESLEERPESPKVDLGKILGKSLRESPRGSLRESLRERPESPRGSLRESPKGSLKRLGESLREGSM